MSNQQKDTSASPPSSTGGPGANTRSDTTASAGAVPVQGQSSESGQVGADIAGRAGTDAAAGATMGGDGGRGLPRQDDEGNPQGEQLTPGAGAAVAGGTGLGEAASADDARVGTSSGQGAQTTGGDASSGEIPPPTNRGGASAA